MEKKDLYKLLAVGFVLIFGIEMVAIGFFNNSNTSKAPGNVPTGSGTIQGSVQDNVTIIRYEPYIIVSGGSNQVDAVKQKLIDAGIATYAVPSAGSTIINLRGSQEVVPAASQFEAENATVLASAVISTSPSLTVAGDGISTKAEGTSFRMQLRPLYHEGAVVPATFSVAVANGQVLGVGSFSVLAPTVHGAQVNARIISLSTSSITVQVPWEGRVEAKQVARASKAAFKEKSFILIGLNSTSSQLSSLKAYPYVTAVQYGVASVQNNFTDRQTAEQ